MNGRIRLRRYRDCEEKRYHNRSSSGNDKTSSFKISSWRVNPWAVTQPHLQNPQQKGSACSKQKYILYSMTKRLYKPTRIFGRTVGKTPPKCTLYTDWMNEWMNDSGILLDACALQDGCLRVHFVLRRPSTATGCVFSAQRGAAPSYSWSGETHEVSR